jgi:hypothetical protein
MENLYRSLKRFACAAPGPALTGLLCICLAACGGDKQDPDPFVEDFGIAFVQRPLVFDDMEVLVQTDIREVLSFNAGADLIYRELASPTASQFSVTAAFTGGMGDVKDVEVSYDGNRLLFAMHAPLLEDVEPEDQPTWNIWEYDIVNNDLRRIIRSNITAEDGQDIAPHYLPDGRIIFSSTRQRRSKAILLDEGKPRQFPALDEDRNEHALVLHVMNADGSGLHQVTFNQSHDLDPTVLSSGEVVFSRWDNMGTRNAISLYRMHPDGTDLQLLYGAHSHATGTNGSDVHFMQPRELPEGGLLSILMPFTDSSHGGSLIEIDTNIYIDNTEALGQNQGILTGPAQLAATVNDVHTDDTVSPGGRFGSAWPLDDGTNRMLVSWSECRLLEPGLIVPCTADRLANPNAVEANPIYGIFIYDRDEDSQLPVVVPQEGFTFTEVVATTPRSLPLIITDKLAGLELDQQSIDEGVGILNIRSVYDVDGVDTAVPDIATLADPMQTMADQRPARFLRIVKAVSIPDDEILDFPESAYGRSSEQLMREIVGYAPIQPDGSVKVKVPANVALAISVLDKQGRRTSDRHQSWLRVGPGETLTCNGCHDHDSGHPHGHLQDPLSLYPGALMTGPPFPNTDPTRSANFTETMAETQARHSPQAMLPTMDIVFDDVWTDETAALRPPDTAFSLAYSDLTTAAPVSEACQSAWTHTCRSIIHYEQHIHPLWSKDRDVDTCTSCHTTAGMTRVPDAQLDLTDGLFPEQPAHFRAYHEMLYPDSAQRLGTSGLEDILVPGPIDPDTGLPTQVEVPVPASMSTAGALASPAFFNRFEPGGSHAGRLQAFELRLLAEWLDIGGQYYNDPFAVPLP